MTETTGIFAANAPQLDHWVQLGVASGRVISVSFPEEPDAGASEDHPLIDRILGYLAGESDGFADVEIALTVPTTHRAVLETLRGVSHGQSVTTETLARTAPGIDEEDADTVREALQNNPTPLFIPDHRVRDAPGATPDDVAATLRSIEGIG